MARKHHSEEYTTRNDPEHRLSRTPVLQDRHWSYIQRKYQMSPRELEIAKLVCRGLSNDQIASDLIISSGTVKTHLRNIYRKVRVNNKLNMLLNFIAAVSHLTYRPQSPDLTVDIPKAVPKTVAEPSIAYDDRGISL